MKINWKVRIKNKQFWLSLIPAVILLVQAVARLVGFDIDLGGFGNNLKEVVNTAFVVLTVLGVVNDPTTATYSDSLQAMGYTEPKCSDGDEETQD